MQGRPAAVAGLPQDQRIVVVSGLNLASEQRHLEGIFRWGKGGGIARWFGAVIGYRVRGAVWPAK